MVARIYHCSLRQKARVCLSRVPGRVGTLGRRLSQQQTHRRSSHRLPTSTLNMVSPFFSIESLLGILDVFMAINWTDCGQNELDARQKVWMWTSFFQS